MRLTLTRLRNFVKHPVTQLVTGLILLISGGTEVVYDFIDAEHILKLGAHHGVALFGLIQALGSLPDVIEGLDESFRAVDEHSQRQREIGISSVDVDEKHHA